VNLIQQIVSRTFTRSHISASARVVVLFCVFCMMCIAGCGEDAQVEQYIVREQAPIPADAVKKAAKVNGRGVANTAGANAKASGSKVRTLAAIVPRDERTWYYKLTGASVLVADEQAKFVEFLQSIKHVQNASAGADLRKPGMVPKWTLPKGWREKPGSGMRYATLMVGPDAHAMELSVTPLGTSSGTMIANIRRWAGMIGIKQVSQEDVANWTKPVTIDGREAMVVDMAGSGSGGSGGMRPPAGPSAPNVPGPVAASDRAVFTAPAGWQKQDPGQFLKHKFSLEEGGQKLELSLSSFPRPTTPSQLVSFITANLTRWRVTQLGLTQLESRKLIETTKEKVLPNFTALAVDYSKDDGSDRIVGLISSGPASMWFIKLRGPSKLIDKHDEAFQAFLKTLKFENDQ
jgi:hypothetical protein